jgi:hypothetical protein
MPFGIGECTRILDWLTDQHETAAVSKEAQQTESSSHSDSSLWLFSGLPKNNLLAWNTILGVGASTPWVAK